MIPARLAKSDSEPLRGQVVPDPWVEHWFRVWAQAYDDRHPWVAAYALARGSLRALRVDFRFWRW